ncbi:golvesin C-terminal-like domain-containing protein [Sphingomonas psychrotolerans]|uniref:GH16 domain-containing protein n=1 Tax=Sphingomonas psychrotolerans TaxID=1327635 RepID=A0A2K8MMN2_9SPHN|nr:family 16 glycosylhydrolase [Sphingomonas psychrotolerans]ATY32551.1 hypothetical protein CVN68_11670 [Sphingomonas psychrotolerans]
MKTNTRAALRSIAVRRALAVPLAALTIVPFNAARADPPSPLYALVWEESFGGTTIDTSRWNFRTDVKALSAQLPANVAIVNGQLSLLMKQENVSGKQYTGGGIVSKQAFGYGYYEVKQRTTSNLGWHNSFWMMAGNGTDTYAAGKYLEIDSVEMDSQSPTRINTGLVLWNGSAGSNAISYDRCQIFNTSYSTADGFNTFGADWREGAVDFYLNGTKYCTVAYSTTTRRQDPINIWLTAIAYIAPVTVGGTPQLYDDVRFYKRDQYVMNGRYGYSESGTGWQDSTVAGFGLIPQRYSCTAGSKSTYAPGFNQSGDYRVYIWKTVNANADTQAEVRVQAPSGTTTTTINFATGTSGWVDIGQHHFNAGTTNPAIGVTNTTQSGCQRAGAVKFIRAA